MDNQLSLNQSGKPFQNTSNLSQTSKHLKNCNGKSTSAAHADKQQTAQRSHQANFNWIIFTIPWVSSKSPPRHYSRNQRSVTTCQIGASCSAPLRQTSKGWTTLRLLKPQETTSVSPNHLQYTPQNLSADNWWIAHSLDTTWGSTAATVSKASTNLISTCLGSDITTARSIGHLRKSSNISRPPLKCSIQRLTTE